MPSFTRDILVDTSKRAWVRFNYVGGAASSYGITGAIFPNELVGYQGLTNPASTELSVTKIFWNIAGASGQNIEIAWGVSGSVTGSPFQYVFDTGLQDYAEEGLMLKNTTTGPTRNNSIQVRNVGAFGADNTATLIMELAKGIGYAVTSITGT